MKERQTLGAESPASLRELHPCRLALLQPQSQQPQSQSGGIGPSLAVIFVAGRMPSFDSGSGKWTGHIFGVCLEIAKSVRRKVKSSTIKPSNDSKKSVICKGKKTLV